MDISKFLHLFRKNLLNRSFIHWRLLKFSKEILYYLCSFLVYSYI